MYLASPQEILEESQRPRPAPAREAGVVLARDSSELAGVVAALGQQGHRIIAVVSQEFGAGWLIVHQEWG